MQEIRVLVFVDWTAQIHNAGCKALKDPIKKAQTYLDWTVKVIERALKTLANGTSNRFKVGLRLYHGWHRGLSPTESRVALRQIENALDFRLGTGARESLFDSQIQYSETLLNALPHRLVSQSLAGMPQIHLPDTYRKPFQTGVAAHEKMVDAALICDVLTHARTDAREWRIILAEDDDLVPALFVSEAWSKDKGGRTILLRRRPANNCLSLEGLLMELER